MTNNEHLREEREKNLREIDKTKEELEKHRRSSPTVLLERKIQSLEQQNKEIEKNIQTATKREEEEQNRKERIRRSNEIDMENQHLKEEGHKAVAGISHALDELATNLDSINEINVKSRNLKDEAANKKLDLKNPFF